MADLAMREQLCSMRIENDEINRIIKTGLDVVSKEYKGDEIGEVEFIFMLNEIEMK